MAGGGRYETVRVRGVGFAPTKKEALLPPLPGDAEYEEASTEQEQDPIETKVLRRAGKAAMKAAKIQKD